MSEQVRVPEGWAHIEIGKCCDVLDGKRIPLNDATRQKMQGNIPYYGANGIVDYVDGYIFDEELILLAEDGGDFENFKTKPIAYRISGKSWINNHAHILKAKNSFFQDYIFYSLEHKDILFYISGGTRSKLNKSSLVDIKILAPKLKQEQQKIAEILSEIDSAIESASELVEKEKHIKTALMQDLLTYGIDENGKIRNPKTHQFKPSPLGDMPQEWDIVELGKVCDVRDGTHDSPKYVDFGIPFVTSKNLTDNGIDFSNIQYIDIDVHKNISQRSKVENGDILFGMIGTIGKPVVVNSEFEFSIKNVALIKKIALNFDVYFLLSYLKSDYFDKNIANIFNGGVQNFISLGMIRQLNILKPHIKEQQKIAEILSSQDEKIEKANQKLNKLKSLKAAMMQDLLSGSVRVNHLLGSEQ